MRIFKSLTVAGLIAVLPITAGAETLKDALRSAYEHSGLLQQNRALLRAADEDVAQAVASLRPVITWAANARVNHSTQGILNSAGDSTTRSASLRVQADWGMILGAPIYGLKA